MNSFKFSLNFHNLENVEGHGLAYLLSDFLVIHKVYGNNHLWKIIAVIVSKMEGIADISRYLINSYYIFPTWRGGSKYLGEKNESPSLTNPRSCAPVQWSKLLSISYEISSPFLLLLHPCEFNDSQIIRTKINLLPSLLMYCHSIPLLQIINHVTILS